MEENQKGNSRGQSRPSSVPRGFAKMDPKRRSEIASAGGRKAHELGTAHKFNTQTGRAAGKKGGKARGRNNR
jgi:uncharacterized protein